MFPCRRYMQRRLEPQRFKEEVAAALAHMRTAEAARFPWAFTETDAASRVAPPDASLATFSITDGLFLLWARLESFSRSGLCGAHS